MHQPPTRCTHGGNKSKMDAIICFIQLDDSKVDRINKGKFIIQKILIS